MATQSDTQSDPSFDVLVRLRSALPSLQPAEHRVAEVVLNDPAGAAGLSITELAHQAGTSVATVARFSRSTGFGGYPQLRLALAAGAARERALSAPSRQPPEDLNADSPLADVVNTIVHHEVRALQETAEHLDLTAMQAAIDAVAGARRTDVIGTGASGGVARDLAMKLHRSGRIAFCWKDFHGAATAAALVGAGDVVIGVSHSGETVDTIEPLRLAGERGATTIAITNFPNSAVASAADIVLTTVARETVFRSGATASRTAQLAVIDILFVGVARTQLAETTDALSRTFDAVDSRRASNRQGQRRTHRTASGGRGSAE